MKEIKVMSPTEMKGVKFFIFPTIVCLLFVIGGFLLIFKDEVVIGLTSIVFFGGCLFLFLRPETTYVPGKSFWWCRLTKEKQERLHLYSFIFALLIIMITIIVVKNWSSVGYGIAGLLAIYYSIKSLKIHDDVDYTTNKAMEDLIGMEIDEKVCASYQNFDATQKKNSKGDNMLVVTNRKIFYAGHNGKVWMILKRSFEDLTKIGYTNSNSSGSESILIMQFKDETSIKLKMDVFEKPISNPTLFFKQFLNVLDAYVCGYDVVKNNSRRRVSIGGSSIENSQSEIANQINGGARRINLELKEDLVTQMKIGENISGNRRIEL